MIIIGGILVLFIYITRLASNEIFSPSNKIHREVGQAKGLSAPRYSSGSHSGICRSKGIRDQFPGDPWACFCNGYFKVHLFLKLKEYKRGCCLIGDVFIWYDYLIKKFLIPMKQATVILIQIVSCNSLLHCYWYVF